MRILVPAGAHDADWLIAKRHYLTASHLPVIMGETTRSLVNVFRWYRDGIDECSNFRMKMGAVLEPLILDAAEVDPGCPIRWTRLETPRLVGMDPVPWAAGSPDQLVRLTDGRLCLVEVKNRNVLARKHYFDGDELTSQASEWTQIQWLLGCTNADVGLLVVNCDGDLLYRLVERDPERLNVLLEEGRKFWDIVKAQDLGALAAMAHDVEERLQITRAAAAEKDPCEFSTDDPALDALLDDYQRAKVEAATATGLVSELAVEIADRIDGATKVETARYKVSWPKSLGARSLDTEALLRANPGLVMEPFYKKGEPFRMGMRITEKK